MGKQRSYACVFACVYVRICVDVIFVICDLCARLFAIVCVCVCMSSSVCVCVFFGLFCVCLFVGVILWMCVAVHVDLPRSLGLGARHASTQCRG
jgi:hypothetical protein